MDRALALQPLPDVPVDRAAERMARRHHAGVLPLLQGQFQPARGDRAGNVVRLYLRHAGAQLLESLAYIACEARLDRFLLGSRLSALGSRLSALLFTESTTPPNIANRIGNSPIERYRPGRFLSDASPQRSDVMIHARRIIHIGRELSVNSCVI